MPDEPSEQPPQYSEIAPPSNKGGGSSQSRVGQSSSQRRNTRTQPGNRRPQSDDSVDDPRTLGPEDNDRIRRGDLTNRDRTASDDSVEDLRIAFAGLGAGGRAHHRNSANRGRFPHLDDSIDDLRLTLIPVGAGDGTRHRDFASPHMPSCFNPCCHAGYPVVQHPDDIGGEGLIFCDLDRHCLSLSEMVSEQLPGYGLVIVGPRPPFLGFESVRPPRVHFLVGAVGKLRLYYPGPIMVSLLARCFQICPLEIEDWVTDFGFFEDSRGYLYINPSVVPWAVANDIADVFDPI
ncbi:predicted protein [Uncinocarpus reesii 1704]|uniref:Uncharacterized protein n=1 Tax=Uncinocarpus reesii (strain UAMH 1704) TaxID=336963 RepID=C4JJF2_UNCRE|nr:uncharacterized protein UREG_01759 [Uncinocarpus reesii 1704]EEP76910.1 predicted protein [Uncinocarpus reesii 1704]